MLALRISALLSSILVQVWVNDVSALNYGEMVACLMSLDKQRFIRANRADRPERGGYAHACDDGE